MVNAGFLDGYDLVVKVHTKRSDWRAAHAQLTGTGAHWRGELLSQLLGDRSNVEAILEAFDGQPRLGLVTADGSVLGPAFWGGNERVTGELLRRTRTRSRPGGLDLRRGLDVLDPRASSSGDWPTCA